MADYSTIFAPFVELFNQGQVQTILLAWLPTKLEPFLSGIMAVDMFLTGAAATGLTALLIALYTLSLQLWNGQIGYNNRVTVQIEYYITGTWGDQYTSIFYEALSWIISKQTKSLNKGSFIVHPTNDDTNANDDECVPPGFIILPEKDQQVTIEYNKRKFNVTYTMPEAEQTNNENSNRNSDSAKPMPSIFLTTVEETRTDVDYITEFLNEITHCYLEDQRKNRIRSRYERNGSYWYRVQALSSNRGLDTVALDKKEEELLRQEIEAFTTDKDFYMRIGMPYRRGILLTGKPGTGKTSLVNAISSQLSRDLYYVNLKNITSDNELSATFSSVPANQIVVLEDVDAQSKVIHKRSKRSSDSDLAIMSITAGPKEKDKPKIDGLSLFSLSTFLGCLDGHIIAEGIIIIMTTNHVEYLDPAVIRPGRMDLRLELGYSSHYQIQKMYRSVVEDETKSFPSDVMAKIPEGLLPPCEVMMTMVLYRKEPEIIPVKIYELVDKYLKKSTDENDKDEDKIVEENTVAEVEESKKDEETKNEDKKDEEKKDEEKKNEEENKDAADAQVKPNEAVATVSKNTKTVTTKILMHIKILNDDDSLSKDEDVIVNKIEDTSTTNTEISDADSTTDVEDNVKTKDNQISNVSIQTITVEA
ncbi:4035_t:CDS:1 [Paraglomus brasilianum]|uniref:4035_t:CDS:1 n=1 Tax=Paraglomus brasilianum TaxID=144538 RepID=A0A9N9FJF2_9GLOM|nr:4035_t:CDS:1 [Paraglomus brasilianum]